MKRVLIAGAAVLAAGVAAAGIAWSTAGGDGGTSPDAASSDAAPSAGAVLDANIAPTPMADAASDATRGRAADAALPPQPAIPIPFSSVCAFSHRGPDDPIVKPNMPGTSHMHNFFGNVTTAANSTFESLSHGDTTCSRPQDRAAYWVPALFVDGQEVMPVGINAYYKTGRRDPSSIQPFPAGLKIVAGNAKATSPQASRVTTFGCRRLAAPVSGRANTAASVPTCPTGKGNGLTMSIHFPDCWNGKDLDSSDHASHMAYSVRGVCPDGYPVPVPALTVHVKYDIAGGPGVTLASGPFYTAHADFFNAWDEPTLTSLVQRCINAQVKCGPKG